MDPNHPVVKLCIEGMQAEAAGRYADARNLFLKAWEARSDDYDACIAAHYVARHQEKPEDTLRWNREALERALEVADGRVQGFYPSLYLNMGWSYEQLSNVSEAHRYYLLADGSLEDVPAGSYRDMVQQGIANGLARTQPKENESDEKHA
jgi:hypothetical protein